ncbi:hypothetical protein GCM10023333_08950 [Ferrimonas pelagia]|uniref:Uncharacterized protein n=1 Tax=Ferrimonas pelagia TaxID=1177826 RepID=A0ABP9EFK3_9GAMM
MFGFGGSTFLSEPGALSIGRINEIDYKTKEVMVEIDVCQRNRTHLTAAQYLSILSKCSDPNAKRHKYA